jgi:hypothetical protein
MVFGGLRGEKVDQRRPPRTAEEFSGLLKFRQCFTRDFGARTAMQINPGYGTIEIASYIH